jgi:sarcosine oxidase subunit gamma
MSELRFRESPLARFDLAVRAEKAREDAGVIAREYAFLGHINLRGDARDSRFTDVVETVIGGELPVAANTVNDAQGNVVYWLGPDEWLIVTLGEYRAMIESELRMALAGLHCAVTDVSGGQTVVHLRGTHVRELLAKGCPIDLHARAFGIGQCAQSHLAKAPILIGQIENQPCFEIIIRRSFADYFWLWLEDAATEYGLAVTA